jgi:hypothetical protein
VAVAVRQVTARSNILAARTSVIAPEAEEGTASSRLHLLGVIQANRDNRDGLLIIEPIFRCRLEPNPIVLRPEAQWAAQKAASDRHQRGIMLRGNLDMILEKVPGPCMHAWQ